MYQKDHYEVLEIQHRCAASPWGRVTENLNKVPSVANIKSCLLGMKGMLCQLGFSAGIKTRDCDINVNYKSETSNYYEFECSFRARLIHSVITGPHRKRIIGWVCLLTANACVFLQLSRDCKVEVQRILHQRALDVKLDPELQKRCMTDLGKWCSEKTDAGQVRHTAPDAILQCLTLNDLCHKCHKACGWDSSWCNMGFNFSYQAACFTCKHL